MDEIFTFPLKMHIGAMSEPIVKEGDDVKRGQCIAEPGGEIGAKIHSSVTGKVVKITEDYIKIERLEDDTRDYIKIKKCSSILESIYEAGIVGAGGAGFPTYFKIKSAADAEYIIANCAECEPLLKHNIKFIEEHSDILVRGIRYAMKAAAVKKAYIAIKEKNISACRAVEKVISRYDDIEVKYLEDIYPAGEERAVIHSIFGKWLLPEELPISAGCIVLNAETLINIARAVDDGKPVIDKDITVCGKLRNAEKPEAVFDIPIGMPVRNIIEEYGGIDGSYGEIILGGPYTGKRGDLKTSVITKTTGGVIVAGEFFEYKKYLGLLSCACTGGEARLKEIAEEMGAEICGAVECKNTVHVDRGIKCLTPGQCPGQAAAILKLKKMGAQRILIGNCSDCTNTVMNCAPKLGIGVYHSTDHIFMTTGHKLTRRLVIEKGEGDKCP